MRRKWKYQIAPLFLLSAVAIVTLPQHLFAQQLVRMELQDGREVVGTLTRDRAGEARYEISSRAPGVVLRSTFLKSQVVSIEELPPVVVFETHPVVPPFSPQRAFTPHESVAAEQEVSSLHIRARAGDWDEDAASDGLLVIITVLDVEEQPVSIDALIRFELQAELFHGLQAESRFAELGEWTIQLKPELFQKGTAKIKLPWKNRHPDQLKDYRPFALLHARLIVPGDGTFEATDSQVPLREYSPIRDSYQLWKGQRYFPQENIPSGAR